MREISNRTDGDKAWPTPRETRLARKQSKVKRACLYRAVLLSLFFIVVTLIFAFQSHLAPSIDLNGLTREEKKAPRSGHDTESVRHNEFDLDSFSLFEIESLLKKLRIDPGIVDGVIEQETTMAIALFEKITDKPITGQPTLRLLTHLRETVFKLSGTPENPIESPDG